MATTVDWEQKRRQIEIDRNVYLQRQANKAAGIDVSGGMTDAEWSQKRRQNEIDKSMYPTNSLAMNPVSKPKTYDNDNKGYTYTPISASSGLSRISGFTPSQAYNDAMAYTQSLLDKINTGRTSYSDKVDEMMNKISNREKFSYDFNTDPLFQNALASAMASGQTAMQDTMGQAASLTGGYGSSYATSAANQRYNDFVQGAYDQLPDFYNLALQAYNMEGQELYNQLGMYRDADNTEYGRLTTAYGLNYQQAQDMYNHDYNNFWDTANYNLSVDKYNNDLAMEAAKFNAQQSLNAAKFNYQKQQDALEQANAAAQKAAETTSGGQGATNAQFNKAYSMMKQAVESYLYGGRDFDNAMLDIWNTYPDLSDEQMRTLYSQAEAIFNTQKYDKSGKLTTADKYAIKASLK